MGHDLDADVSPVEASLEFAVKKRGGYLGADAVAQRRANGVRSRLASIVLDAEAWPVGNEPVYADGEFAGEATSAAYGYRVGAPVVLAYLDTDVVPNPESARVELDLAGERVAGTASLRAAFDPGGERMRAIQTRAAVA